MQLDLAQLAALSAAVTEGTFEAAARALNVTPSAVSQRIKALESTVGRVLLQRSKPVRATESGEAILLLARQIETLAGDAVRGLGDADGPDGLGGLGGPDGAGAGEGSGGQGRAPHPNPVRMPIAVNADSLATWILPALAELSDAMVFDLYREDEAHTTALLREGTVMAAITAVAYPVQGCSSTLLGSMRYRPMASPAFAETWFPDGITSEALAHAPVVVFDRRDELQDAYLRSRVPGAVDPPRHYVPASGDFVAAVRLGFGWGMVPDLQSDPRNALPSAPALVDLDSDGAVEVPLYWQQWQLRTRSLERLAEVVATAARRTLR
ncbi:LysR family transcriptional regulator ArgP [Herbiconiux sp. CPCC 205763]|uniref:LysR family transcriptional regulator ArgP n=1 Tax=Herbiconiux aconitum TaxID=2970913 RepID=A0ABT2GRW0_9MICO|nr:LysR family transcriptional regulator ArgP [Herbiconiux aconitum]MCS5718963.1 LysR family transcriptional regulator ArgP [Herbiconiux aconitum]